MADFLIETWDTLKLILLYGWPFMILIWFAVLKMLWKRWPVEAVIIEKRGKNLIKTNDRAGRYKDPYTGIEGYKLQKSGDPIPVVNYEWVMHNAFKPTTLFDRFVNLVRGDIGTIFLFRYGSRQYKPLKIRVGNTIKTKYTEIRDKDNNPILTTIYEQLDPRNKLGSLDFEVVDWDNMNFMVQEQTASIERRKKKSEWIKAIAIPLVMIAVTAVVCIVMLKFSFDYSATLHQSPNQQQTSQKAETPKIPVISDVIPGQ